MPDWMNVTPPVSPDWSLTELSLAFGIAATVFAALWLGRGVARRQYARLAATDRREVLELPMRAAGRTTLAFMLVVAGFVGSSFLGLEGASATMLRKVVTIGFFWQAGLWASTAVNGWLDHRRRLSLQEDKAAAGSIAIIRFVARVAVWVMVLLLTLDNLGINITALVAGLGIGGIAVALALQNVLGDLFASLSIALDQPFVLGDFVVVGEHMGTVEHIGIKSTRLRSLGGEQIVIANADLLSGRLRNYGRMQERRVAFTIGVTYETPRPQLEALPPLLRETIENQDGVRFDRAHFARFGPSSLDFDAVYYVTSPDYNRYMDVQQAINFALFAAFERIGVQFAYPTQKLWLAGDPSVAGGPQPDASLRRRTKAHQESPGP